MEEILATFPSSEEVVEICTDITEPTELVVTGEIAVGIYRDGIYLASINTFNRIYQVDTPGEYCFRSRTGCESGTVRGYVVVGDGVLPVVQDTCAVLEDSIQTVTGNAAQLNLIDITDTNTSCISAFTYDGVVYPVDPNVCLKDAGEVFDGDFSAFALAFRDAFESLTGIAMPSITDFGYSEITASGVYTGISFSVAGEDTSPVGTTWDGTHVWVVGSGTQSVYQYTAAGVYTGTSFSVSSEDAFPTGITWDGSNLWVIGSGTNSVYQYTLAGVYTGFSFSVSPNGSFPTGITWDGSHFWVLGDIADTVYQYTAAGVYTGTSFSVSSEDAFPTGITWDGSNLWVVGSGTNSVYQYAAGVYTGTSFSVSTEDASPQGIAWDGMNFVLVGSSTDSVYLYAADAVISRTLYVPSSELFNASLLTAVTMVNKDAGGAVVETKADVVGVYQEYTYDTLTFDAIYQRVNQVICYSGCDDVSRRIETLDGAIVDPSFVVINCDDIPVTNKIANGSGIVPTTTFDDGSAFPETVEDYTIICVAGEIIVTMPSGDTFELTADSTRTFGEGTERDVYMNGLSVVGKDEFAKWQIVADI